jgi:hypothetical protein
MFAWPANYSSSAIAGSVITIVIAVVLVIPASIIVTRAVVPIFASVVAPAIVV